MGGVNIELMVTSVVILVVHQDGIAVFKRESQTPVSIDADRPVAGEPTLEEMPVPARTVHVFGPCGGIQSGQLPGQARSVCGLDPGAGTGSEEALNAFVPEASDHEIIVARGATHRNCCDPLSLVRIPYLTKNRGSEN